jgi:hypothetical protein
MIMGTHVPLCLLAGIAAAAAGETVFGVRCSVLGKKVPKTEHRTPNTERRSWAPALFVGLIVLLTAPTNVLRMLEDIRETGERPEDLNWFSAYWPEADLEATAWIRAHTATDAAFFCTPLSGRYIAATAGRTVYAGHWGETPHFPERIGPTIDFFRKPQSPDERLLQLHTSATNYVYQGITERRAGQVDLSRDPGLEKVYDADGVMIYRVRA